MALALWAVGCSKQNTYHDDAAKQSAVEAQVRDQQLAPVLGTYCGKMHLVRSGMDFDVNMIVVRGEDNVHAPQSSDPTLTVRVPKLAGSMRFPAVENAGSSAYVSMPELIQATGGYGVLPFDNGDYDPQTRQIYFPFSVPGHQGEYGEVRGAFNNGRYTGTWLSNSYRTVGTFELNQCDPSQAGTDGGAS